MVWPLGSARLHAEGGLDRVVWPLGSARLHAEGGLDRVVRPLGSARLHAAGGLDSASLHSPSGPYGAAEREALQTSH